MNIATAAEKNDPFLVLGLPVDASEQDIRARYLELIKEFPPEKNPDRFRQIQAAYQLARDPLALAHQLIELSNPQEPPSWESVLAQHAQQTPQMSVDFLLSLGNLPPNCHSPAESSIVNSEASP